MVKTSEALCVKVICNDLFVTFVHNIEMGRPNVRLFDQTIPHNNVDIENNGEIVRDFFTLNFDLGLNSACIQVDALGHAHSVAIFFCHELPHPLSFLCDSSVVDLF